VSSPWIQKLQVNTGEAVCFTLTLDRRAKVPACKAGVSSDSAFWSASTGSAKRDPIPGVGPISSQSLNRHEKPRPRRRLPRPLDDRVVRPSRLETEAPDLEKLRKVERPIRLRRRYVRPMPGGYGKQGVPNVFSMKHPWFRRTP
jgi:hypothetical protein